MELPQKTVDYILNFGEQHPDFKTAYKQNVRNNPELYPPLDCIMCGVMFKRDENNNELCADCISDLPL